MSNPETKWPCSRWHSYLVLTATCACLVLASAVAQAATGSRGPSPIEAAVAQYERGQLREARIAFERLARNGQPLAHYNLAMMHLRSELPSARVARAEQLLRRAAAGGLVRAHLALALLYEQGLHDGPEGISAAAPDMARALPWYRSAAELGSVDAQVALGTAAFLGRGVPQDMAEAAHWFRAAARGGDVGAQYIIASMYEKGEGVDVDLRLARYWYDIAARNGDEAAPAKRDEIDRLVGATPGS